MDLDVKKKSVLVIILFIETFICVYLLKIAVATHFFAPPKYFDVFLKHMWKTRDHLAMGSQQLRHMSQFLWSNS